MIYLIGCFLLVCVCCRKVTSLYRLPHTYMYKTHLKGFSFKAEYLELRKSGLLIIPKGYVWDGCSFTFSFLDLFTFGTPEGRIHFKTGKPVTYYASLVHDALYQYHHEIGISKKVADQLFLKMLNKEKYPLARVYYLALRTYNTATYILTSIKDYFWRF